MTICYFDAFSGISGVQPKILVRDENAFAEMEHTGHRLSQSYRGATHIVKLWEPDPYVSFRRLAAKVTVYNVSLVNEAYELVHAPTEVALLVAPSGFQLDRPAEMLMLLSPSEPPIGLR